jgi:co-chaperonin GroES (HSP10)
MDMLTEQAQTLHGRSAEPSSPRSQKSFGLEERFRPLNDQILVRREASPNMQGMIHLPESAQLTAQGRGEVHQGVVVALGPGDWVNCSDCDGTGLVAVKGHGQMPCPTCNSGENARWDFDEKGNWLGGGGIKRAPIDLQIGDRILFWFHEGAEHTIQGEKYIIIHEEQHVLGVLEQ